MSNTEHLAAQVIANMSEEMKSCFIAAGVEDQTGIATQLGIESLQKNLKMQVMFQTNPEFKTFVERSVLQILAA
jgi:hypothetical protein